MCRWLLESGEGAKRNDNDVVVQSYFTWIQSIEKSSVSVHRSTLLAIQLTYNLSDSGDDLDLFPECISSYG